MSPYSVRGLAVLCEIERIGSLDLHAERSLERFDARFELRVLLQILAVYLVQLLHEIEFPPLFLPGRYIDCGCSGSSFDRGHGGIDTHCLKIAGQKCGPPKRGPPGGSALGRSETKPGIF